MSSLYRRAVFLISAARLNQTPPDLGYEVAFAGRSNAGKSSAINTLCDQSRLTRTSKTPGRTQLLNFFTLDAQRRLVDLPGYGYAQVAATIRQNWQTLTLEYLSQRRCLCGVILLMDIRHPLTDLDQRLLDWNAARQRPTHILLTKADKLKRGPALLQLKAVERQLREQPGPVSVQLFSALKQQGIERAHQVLDTWLESQLQRAVMPTALMPLACPNTANADTPIPIKTRG